MGMHVFSILKQTLKRKDKSRDADWDFGARQSPPDAATRRDSNSVGSPRRRRSASMDGVRHHMHPPSVPHTAVPRQQQLQHRRVSAAVGSGDARGPEDDVLVAAGETAKEVRTAAKPAESRRRVHSVAAARLSGPMLRHASSTLDMPDSSTVLLPSSPTAISRSVAGSPTPSIRSVQSIQSGFSDASRRAALLAGKRSMPQLHNVWENFLEEAAEDVDSFSFPLPPHSPSKFATVHVSSRTDPARHHHTPTSSSSSASTATTSASVSTVKTLPCTHPSDVQSQSSSSSHLRSRGHTRTSHHTSSSTSSTTTGSTSSMAAFSSASSMTTAHDHADDIRNACDDPVPPTPRSSVAMSPKSFKFADPSLSPPMGQRLRKSPTSPVLQHRTPTRGVSPSSSTSSESLDGSIASLSHSQSTTPTPSSACPTPTSIPCGPSTSFAKPIDRVNPVMSRAGGHRRAPEAELPEQPLSPASMQGRKSSSNSYRFSSLAGRSQIELGLPQTFESREEREDEDEDELSELGYYGPSSFRTKSLERRPSNCSTASSSSQSATPSSRLPVVPPLRHSSRPHLRAVAAQSASPGESILLRPAKSASNIKHEARTLSERPSLTSSHTLYPLPVARSAANSGASGNPHDPYGLARPLHHARSQTLQYSHPQVMVNASNSRLGPHTSVPPPSSSTRQVQGRARSGSASVVYNQTYPQRDGKTPVRPPPAPPLDISTAKLQPPVAARSSVASSPLTPANAVQWGYAL